MNFAAFSAVGAGGTHFVTTGGQMPVAKLQQNVTNNGTTLSQVVGMVGGMAMGEGGVQYVRALEGGATLQHGPQLITVPIALPGAKPGDPQQTVQIQVLSPQNLLQAQQQSKYHMQIPIQGLQPGALLTLAYSPEGNETGGIQLIGQNSLGDGLQVLAAMPPEMQLVQPSQTQTDNKEQTNMHQVFITPNQQIIINNPQDQKSLNNNTNLNNNNTSDVTNIVIKEECEDIHMDDESSQGTESSETLWRLNNGQQELAKYLSQLPPQQAQALPVSLQQFLKLNPTDMKNTQNEQIQIKILPIEENKVEPVAEAVLSEDGTLRIQTKKKKKYKKKPKPALPKPGQVRIATTSDGTPIFCCPECQMAYSEKEQLEVHLVVHKIERRFICGICGAGLKRKEHLERHKLGHNPERPYVCTVCRKGFKRREHLNLHTVIHTGVKTEMCNECGKGFYRKDHLRKHTRSHESKRARDEAEAGSGGAAGAGPGPVAGAQGTGSAGAAGPAACADVQPVGGTNMMPEITIHVPTSANMQVPVQISIPQHVMTSLAAAQQQQASQVQSSAQHNTQHGSPLSPQHNDAHAQLEALLAQHT